MEDRALLNASSFACLTYHAIGEAGGQYVITETQFRDQLGVLRSEAYVVEGFEGLELRLRSGHGLPERYAVLTVDDGRVSALSIADLLRKHDCQASFFVIRDRSASKPGYVREKDIRELRRRGFSLGTHGTTHRGLAFLPKAQCLAELAESKRWLEDVIGEEVRYMAAPGGFVSRNVLRLAYEVGYSLIGTCKEWVNSASALKLPGTVNRVNVRRHFSLNDFRRILESDPGFYLRRRLRSALLWLPKQILSR
jgi:peptidoglycan/xylan/chitin deacetylase (PgdA/CDA1 family)